MFLLTLFEMNIYVIPILCLFFASFAVMQEKEFKTLLMMMARSGSYGSFLWRKSVAVQTITIGMFLLSYFVLMIPVKFVFSFHATHFLSFLAAITVLIVIFNQIGLLLGSVCRTKIQLIGANLFVLFFFLYLYDFVLLYMLPNVTYDNVQSFALLYFLQPMHTLRFFLETSLGVFSLDYLSRTMEKFFSFPALTLVALNIVVWVGIVFFASVLFYRKGEQG